jgi:hypothetical protein
MISRLDGLPVVVIGAGPVGLAARQRPDAPAALGC